MTNGARPLSKKNVKQTSSVPLALDCVYTSLSLIMYMKFHVMSNLFDVRNDKAL